MASQYELTDWILKNSDSLDLRVTALTWIKTVHPGMVDLSATVTLDGKDFEGRGSDANEDRALGKAVCEAIERFVCYSHAIPSTGVAGHYDERLAKKNAWLELIERRSLSLHIEHESSPRVIHTKEMKIAVAGKQTTARLHLFEISSTPEVAVVLCLVEGIAADSAFGGILGLGCSERLEEATAKSEIECLRNVAALAETPLIPLSKKEFLKIEMPTAEDRRRLLFDVDYCSLLLRKLLSGTKSSVGQSPELLPTWTNLNLPNTIPTNCPLQFVRCIDQSNQKPMYLEFVG